MKVESEEGEEDGHCNVKFKIMYFFSLPTLYNFFIK